VASKDKPYRIYRGGRAKGPIRHEPLKKEAGGRPDGRDSYSYKGPKQARKPRRWRRRILLVVGVILLVFLVWAVLGYLAFRSGIKDANERLDPRAERALTPQDGMLLSNPSTILVLGADVGGPTRPGDQGRSDSMVLIRTDPDNHKMAMLFIPRDLRVDIPRHGPQKINAAYAFGGPALTIETVEGFLGNGLEINHLVEVDFEDFPELIDALGGITVDNKTRICSPPFDNFWKGLTFRKGEIELNGTRALGYARVRKNSCAPGEDDRARAARQQEVLRAMGDKVSSPGTFFRLPWVSWRAPRALKSDMRGPGLMALFADLATGNSNDTEVLKAGCCINGSNLFVSEGAKRDAVRKLLEGD
jgi:LCP family protein required for cell wall assembly